MERAEKRRNRYAALLAPAFTDPKLARLLMLAVSQAGLTAERKAPGSHDDRDFGELFEVCEKLRYAGKASEESR